MDQIYQLKNDYWIKILEKIWVHIITITYEYLKYNWKQINSLKEIKILDLWGMLKLYIFRIILHFQSNHRKEIWHINGGYGIR